ncbi:restriction endonuclease subunit S [Corynebacterium diphtheriae]|uniref:Type I restriction/modification system DNA specificity protein n=2 Tax=Corynebacterium diphtheriae TaxID=1717 RepID=Q6NEG1_CORDI|nr:restriction endonuclease subunit S [Corynebacterium diphtheriae]AEX82209.1 type I restriction enzyme, S subunit [Corynebacterium diphtheriae HC04]ARB88329.1 restriction endonuclease subunit S [Corynebacterium diphtheriae]KKA81852.1 restriction endonuclease subunit S [Corynebacterium diphtheriae]MBG9226975.1 restriction endonuclease subunit S [Corynebacterium diphtheriae bv. gravis]MBG9250258.1 restriction endonuclease subunit S [Corynebacterium diphtheriae bv. mitis]
MRIQIGELIRSGVLELGDGYRTKRSELSQFGYAIVRAGDVVEIGVTASDSEFVDQRFDKAIGRKTVRLGDVVITTKGTVGRVAEVSKVPNAGLAVYSPQVCYLRSLQPSILHQRYLKYLLMSPATKYSISTFASSSDMAPYLSLSDFKSMVVDLPSLEDQRAIADVLGALDDKIAENQRVIQLSEQLAMTFYRSTEKSESSLTFADVAGIYGGGTPSTKNPDFWDGEIRWATPTDITALKGPWLCGTARSITEEGLSKSSGSLHPEGSILMTSRATVGHVAFIDAPTTTNQGFINLVPQEAYRYWLYFQLKQRTSEFIAWANGATFLELSRGTFKKLPFQACAETELEKFNSVVAPLMKRVLKAQKENQVLAATRDELLPLLMNGKITVAEAKEAAGDVGVVKQNQQEEGDSSV